MRKILMAALTLLGLLAGCDREPSYRGVSFIAYNYTQFDIDSVSVKDEDGRSAGAGHVSVGGGGGSVSCCYSLKGTEFTVEWNAYDPEILRDHIYDKNIDQFISKKNRTATFAGADVPPGNAPLVLELHIYPDEHVEMALSRELDNTRLPIVETTDWLWRQHKDELPNFRDIYELGHVVARVTKTSWGRYRIENVADMREYMMMYFLVASDFDQDPAIKAVLEKKDRRPGDVARAIESLSPDRIAALKNSGSAPGDKNG